jgi:SAM-dependent methyltransferase
MIRLMQSGFLMPVVLRLQAPTKNRLLRLTYACFAISRPERSSFLLTQISQAENVDDVDSALDVSINGSYSTSLRSSIQNYKYEHGRRYHGYHDGEYPLPNDEAEQDRMDMLHHIWRMMLGGGLLRRPLNYPPQRILDVGTGTGIWAMEIAEVYPQAVVIGTDLSPIQPGWVPPNCKFYVDDAESEWEYTTSEHFDLIHGRSLGGSLANWPNFYRQVFRNLKPGGTLEMQEHEAWMKADDATMERATWTAEWNRVLNDASAIFGKKLNVAENHKMWMEEAGFIDVQDDVFKVSNDCSSNSSGFAHH